LLSRRTLFWTAWILFAASALLPAPAGSFVGDASGISVFYVLGKVIVWSRAAPGSAASLDFGRVVVITLAGVCERRLPVRVHPARPPRCLPLVQGVSGGFGSHRRQRRILLS
jgi:hypothetical protein